MAVGLPRHTGETEAMWASLGVPSLPKGCCKPQPGPSLQSPSGHRHSSGRAGRGCTEMRGTRDVWNNPPVNCPAPSPLRLRHFLSHRSYLCSSAFDGFFSFHEFI